MQLTILTLTFLALVMCAYDTISLILARIFTTFIGLLTMEKILYFVSIIIIRELFLNSDLLDGDRLELLIE